MCVSLCVRECYAHTCIKWENWPKTMGCIVTLLVCYNNVNSLMTWLCSTPTKKCFFKVSKWLNKQSYWIYNICILRRFPTLRPGSPKSSKTLLDLMYKIYTLSQILKSTLSLNFPHYLIIHRFHDRYRWVHLNVHFFVMHVSWKNMAFPWSAERLRRFSQSRVVKSLRILVELWWNFFLTRPS